MNISFLKKRHLPFIGTTSGIVGGAIIADILNKKELKKVLEENKKNLVDSKNIIESKGDDNLKLVSDKRNLKGLKLGWLTKAQLNTILSDKKILEGNAAYIPMKDKSLILSKGKANKFLVGHEIGHHYDYRDKDLRNKLRRFFRTTMTREREAWKKSPFADQKGEIDIKDPALKTYSRVTKYPIIGAVSGGTLAILTPKFISIAKKLKTGR